MYSNFGGVKVSSTKETALGIKMLHGEKMMCALKIRSEILERPNI